MEHNYVTYSNGWCRCPVCREAWAAYTRWYRTDPLARDKNRARALLRSAIRRGVVVPQPCGVCGSKQVQAHHDDYTKALVVSWLCRQHHQAVDGGVGNGPSVWAVAA